MNTYQWEDHIATLARAVANAHRAHAVVAAKGDAKATIASYQAVRLAHGNLLRAAEAMP